MLTITYETFYTSDKEYIGVVTHERYQNQSRKVRLMCPGAQYLPAIKELFQSRGFTLTIVDER